MMFPSESVVFTRLWGVISSHLKNGILGALFRFTPSRILPRLGGLGREARRYGFGVFRLHIVLLHPAVPDRALDGEGAAFSVSVQAP
jgi:hypothetical protein